MVKKEQNHQEETVEMTEKEAGQSEEVEVTAGEEARDVPFTKVEDAWKFDYQAYAEKYPAPAPEKGKKKKKKKKKKKRKG